MRQAVSWGQRWPPVRDRCDEPIASPRESLNKARVFGAIPQRFSYFSYGTVDGVVEFNIGIIRPNPLLDVFASDNLAGTLQKQSQDFERLLLHPDPDAVLAQLSAAHVQLEHAETMSRLLLLCIDHRKQGWRR